MPTQIIKATQFPLSLNPISPIVDTTQAGFASTAPNDPLKVLRGDGGWNYRAPWQRYNAIRNPEMIVTQRGVGSSPSAGYTIDGWQLQVSGVNVNWSQIAAAIPPDASGNNWYPYTPYAFRVSANTGAIIPAAGYCWAVQYIEGLMAEKLKDNPTSISFLVRSSRTGTFSVTLRDSAAAYGYTTPVTIPTANVWQRVAVPNIPAFTSSGTFPDGTGQCYNLGICMGVGTTYAASANNAWVSGNVVGSSGQTNFMGTQNATFDFTLVQHEPNPVCTPYVRRELVDEIALNYRYLWVLPASIWLGWLGGNGNWTAEFNRLEFPVMMRANPTLLPGTTFAVANGAAGTPAIGVGGTAITNLENTGTAWSASAYNGNWAQVANGGFTAEL